MVIQRFRIVFGETIQLHERITDAGVPEMSDVRFFVRVDLGMFHEDALIFFLRRAVASARGNDVFHLVPQDGVGEPDIDEARRCCLGFCDKRG